MKQITYTLLAFAALFSACKDADNPTPDNNGTAEAAAPLIQYTIANKYPHDTASFTQGLVVYKGQLYESTGSPGENISNNGSWVGPLDLKTGKGEKKAVLDKNDFGEGMTILNDKVYYITWQSRKGFVYDLATFKKIKEFGYNTDGWGLTNDGQHLIMSDGTNKLYFYSQDSLKLLNIISVNDHNGPVANINELEYINGFIYANQWETPYILKIDPASGKVTARVDLSNLVTENRNAYPNADVLNGIAYDSVSGKIYVTGKKWPNLYEIKIQ